MNRIHLLLCLAFAPLCLFSEVCDTASLRVTYVSRYANYANPKSVRTDTMALDVGKEQSHFYSLVQSHYEERLAKLNAQNLPQWQAIAGARKLGSQGQKIHIVKRPVGGDLMRCYDCFTLDFVAYEEADNRQDWRLEDADTVICGYKCRAASADVRGRKWRVWYTEEIPLPDGPWKLHGLPGLILEAREADGFYSFACVGIEKVNIEMAELPERRYAECSFKDYLRLYYRYHDDPLLYLKNKFGTSIPSPAKRKSDVISIECKPLRQK